MSQIDILRERIRQQATGDKRFTGEYPYALELKSPGVETGRTIFELPLGPQSVRMQRVLRQSVTPTLGGLVAEERGLAWMTLEVEGHFGLLPKHGTDTTKATSAGLRPVSLYTRLSGPAWTRRMLAHFFDRYAELKSDPTWAHKTFLIWHNFKDEEHFVIVPEEIDTTRTVQTRMMYPWSFRAKIVGLADAIRLPERVLTNPAKVVKGIKGVVAMLRTGVATVQAAVLEVSEILGEVRAIGASIDAVMDDVGAVVQSATDVIEGRTDTVNLGAGFGQSVIAALDDVLDLMETAEAFPADVRASFRSMSDGLHMIVAQFKRIESADYRANVADARRNGAGVGSASQAALQAAADAGPATSSEDLAAQSVGAGDLIRAQAGALPEERPFTEYAGFTRYVVQRGDTLAGLAARYLGDATRWYEVAILNGLRPPYVSHAGGPGVARPGTVLALPLLTALPDRRVLTDGFSAERLYGRDLRLTEVPGSQPGAPLVDIEIDPRTRTDAATIAGIGNLAQALQMRSWTARGSIPLFPEYGIPRIVGFAGTEATITAQKLSLRTALLEDDRVERIASITETVTDDKIEYDVDVVPVGAVEPVTLAMAME